jgi:hypothetical protein
VAGCRGDIFASPRRGRAEIGTEIVSEGTEV